jgi:hypothetical protein
MTGLVVVLLILLGIYLVLIHKERINNKRSRKLDKEILDRCKLEQCEGCPYKDYCYLKDDEIEKED